MTETIFSNEKSLDKLMNFQEQTKNISIVFDAPDGIR